MNEILQNTAFTDISLLVLLQNTILSTLRIRGIKEHYITDILILEILQNTVLHVFVYLINLLSNVYLGR